MRRRFLILLALAAALAAPGLAAASTAASAGVQGPPVSCDSYGTFRGPIILCDFIPSPGIDPGTSVTWTVTSAAILNGGFTFTGGSSFSLACSTGSGYSAAYSYVSGGVTYSNSDGIVC